MLLRAMNAKDHGFTKWSLGLLPDIIVNDALDVGCGGGVALRLIGARFPEASLSGIDISEESVRFAMGHNRSAVAEGRCSIVQGGVSSLPYGEGAFDLVTAFETHYFWPSLDDDLAEVVRVLRPGGVAMLVANLYPHPDFDARNARFERRFGFRLTPVPELCSILESLGCEVIAHLDERRNWMCVIGIRR